MKKELIVKNMDDFHNTIAEVIVENKISYIPKVSVIIPVYNSEMYLRECLDSVVHQTLKEIEIICVDDGSTDNSLSILKEYAEKDKRFTILKQQNLYAGIARNAGLSVAKGDYLSFLDSDDVFELNMFEIMEHFSRESDLDICICQSDFYGDKKQDLNNQTLDKTKIIFPSEYQDSLFKISNPALWTKLYRKKFIVENNIRCGNTRISNDVVFSLLSLASANKICRLDNIFVHYREHQKNLTATREKFFPEFLKTISMLKKELKQRKLYNLYEKSYQKFVYQASMYELDQNRYKDKLVNELKPYLNRSLFKKLRKNMGYVSFLGHFFSIQNQELYDNKWYKVIYLLGIKFSFRNKKKEKFKL